MEPAHFCLGQLRCLRSGVADVQLGFLQWNLIEGILTITEGQIIVEVSSKLD